MSEIVEFGCSDWLKENCADLWDINNRLSDVLDIVHQKAESVNCGNGLPAMNKYVKDNWTRQDLINYNMGNIFQRGRTVWWAMKFKSKIQLLRHILENATNPIKLEVAKNDIGLCYSILNSSHNLDHARYCYILDQFNYWNSLDDEKLYDI